MINWNILKKAWEYLSVLPSKALAVLVIATPVLFVAGYIGYMGVKEITTKLDDLSAKLESNKDIQQAIIVYVDKGDALLAARDSAIEVKIINKLDFILKNQKALAKEGIEEYMKEWKDGIFIYRPNFPTNINIKSEQIKE